MSIWISRGLSGLTLTAALALAGCVPSDIAPVAPTGPSRIAVSGGAVVIAGPAGYCVDRQASRDGNGNAFVLIGTCGGSGQTPVLLTASVLAAAPAAQPLVAAFPEMAKFLQSGAGRAALSRSGRASDVTVAEVLAVSDVMYIRVQDRSGTDGAPVEPEYWRAIFSVKGRIVTLSVLGLGERPVAAATKRRTLDAFVGRVRRENHVAAGT
jgi:hypothetical protein